MKTRYRIHTRLFRKPLVVLQVAEQRPYNFDPMTDIKPGGYFDHWRDATVEDITETET